MTKPLFIDTSVVNEVLKAKRENPKNFSTQEKELILHQAYCECLEDIKDILKDQLFYLLSKDSCLN